MDEQEFILSKKILNIFMYWTQYDSNVHLIKQGHEYFKLLWVDWVCSNSPELTAPFVGQVRQGTEENHLWSCQLSSAARISALQSWISAEDDLAQNILQSV